MSFIPKYMSQPWIFTTAITSVSKVEVGSRELPNGGGKSILGGSWTHCVEVEVFYQVTSIYFEAVKASG